MQEDKVAEVIRYAKLGVGETLSQRAEALQQFLRDLIPHASFIEKIGLRAAHGAITKARQRFNF